METFKFVLLKLWGIKLRWCYLYTLLVDIFLIIFLSSLIIRFFSTFLPNFFFEDLIKSTSI